MVSKTDSKPRICHVTSVHPYNDTRIFFKECCSLTVAGFETHLVAPGAADMVAGGVYLHGVHKRSTNRIMRMTGTVNEVYGIACSVDADVYHLHDPELIFAGILLKLFRRKKVIYDVHEDYPKSIMASEWIHPVLRAVIGQSVAFAEWLGSKIFDGIVAATPSIAGRFPQMKTVVVQNFPILDELLPDAAIPYKQRLPVIAYIGSISKLRGAKEMVEAAGLLPEMSGLRLYFVGMFSPKEVEIEMSRVAGWNRVEFLGWQPRRQMAEVLGKSRMGLVLFHNVPNHVSAQPNKLFEYMAAGIPLIASNFAVWKAFVETNKCGICVDPLNPKEIANAILRIFKYPEAAKTMGENGRKAIEEKYNWENESKKLLSIYTQLSKNIHQKPLTENKESKC